MSAKSNQRYTPLQRELADLNRRGRFMASVLTDSDGLPIAAATVAEKQQAEMLAAVAPLVQRMVQRSNERAGLSAAQEVVVNNADRSRLVCRFFEAREQALILACVVPEQAAYRRAMSQAAQAIQRIWDE